VEWTRFPPLGKRGFDGAGVDAEYMLADPLQHLQHGNREVFLALQIEDREAVDCVEDIARVEGVDLLFIGPADLTISYGVAFDFDHGNVQRAIDRVAAAARTLGNGGEQLQEHLSPPKGHWVAGHAWLLAAATSFPR
jgi:2-keto-3-deoxy-L-rhamnonate aldolase RhmA